MTIVLAVLIVFGLLAVFVLISATTNQASRRDGRDDNWMGGDAVEPGGPGRVAFANNGDKNYRDTPDGGEDSGDGDGDAD